RLTSKSLSTDTMRLLWWRARNQDPALLAQTQSQVVSILQPFAQQIASLLQPFGISAPPFGVRGSLATGWTKDGVPWNANYFDVDGYMVNSQLEGLIPGAPLRGGGRFVSLIDLRWAPGFRSGQAGNGQR